MIIIVGGGGQLAVWAVSSHAEYAHPLSRKQRLTADLPTNIMDFRGFDSSII